MTVQDQLQEMRQFALERGSNALMNMVDNNYVEIEQDYQRHKEPDGPGNAMSWFNQEFEHWRLKREAEDTERQEFLQKVLAQAEEIGDAWIVNGRVIFTAKSIIRRLYMHLGIILEHADIIEDDGKTRGVTDFEIAVVLDDLYHAYEDLVNREKTA